jgi:hypothetical protein
VNINIVSSASQRNIVFYVGLMTTSVREEKEWRTQYLPNLTSWHNNEAMKQGFSHPKQAKARQSGEKRGENRYVGVLKTAGDTSLIERREWDDEMGLADDVCGGLTAQPQSESLRFPARLALASLKHISIEFELTRRSSPGECFSAQLML